MGTISNRLCKALQAVLKVDSRRRHVLGAPNEGIALDYAQAADDAREAVHLHEYTAAREFSKEEERLLLYLETCAVDYGGLVDGLMMNAADRGIATHWVSQRFIGFGRVMLEHIRGPRCLWVTLSPEAWACAHRLRIERCARMLSKRTWKATSEQDDGRIPFTDPLTE